MTNQPLNSGEQGKLLIFTLLFAPSVFFGVGAIPAIFLGFGLYMMKKNEDFSSVETAVKYFNGYLLLVLVVFVSRSLYIGFGFRYEYASNGFNILHSEVWIGFVFAAIAFTYSILVQMLFLNPLKSHREWVVVNGIFSSKPKSAMQSSTGAEMSIMNAEKLKQYSVADELLKWAKLKEDGHITEEEFSEARKKLLKRS